MSLPNLFATALMPTTYLEACLKDGHTLRWPEAAMPIPVYIAPFRWYEAHKQREAALYVEMARDCFREWVARTDRLVTFRWVDSLNESQIDLKWRRVDRKSLGHCQYHWNKQGAIYSAEIQIGISDGVLHRQYDSAAEVRHTILHEIGHALGLVGHSPYGGDIMYVPHQYNVTQLSPLDVETMRWLYRLPIRFDYVQTALAANLPTPWSVDGVLAYLAGETPVSETPQGFSAVLHDVVASQPKVDLVEEVRFLEQRGQFLLATSQIEVEMPPPFLPYKKA